MFTKKSIKIILAWICLLVMLIPYVSTVVTAAETVIVNTPYGNVKLETKTATLQSIFTRNGEYGYKIGGYGVLKIWNTEGTETEDNFYCLEPNKSFPEAEKETYTNKGDLSNISVEAIKTYKQEVGEEKYNAILRLKDFILFQEASAEEMNEFIRKVFVEKIAYDYMDGIQFGSDEKIYDSNSDYQEYEDAYIKEISKFLTIEDIHVAQQLALWYLTNPTDNKYYGDTYTGNEMGDFVYGYNVETDKFLYNLPAISLVDIKNESKDINSITKKYIGIVYNYLIIKSITPKNVPVTGLFFTYPEIDKTVKPVATITDDNNYYVVGPFKVKANEGNPTYVDPETYDIKLSVENYELYSDKECTNKITETDLDKILDQEFFVKMSSETNASEVKLTITYKEETKKTATLWEPENGKYQKVVLITDEKSLKDPQSIAAKLETGDLALRKFIVSINGEKINRAPDIDFSKLLQSDTTAIYNHAKNPIEVETGDKIVYQINVYNEGLIDAIVREVTDYLPEGLSLVEDSSINEKYNWQLDSDGKIARTTCLDEVELEAINEEAMSVASIQIECIVDEGLKAEKVLTNVAEITLDNIKDRDSNTSSIKKDTIDDTFAGNTSNKDDLTDSDYFYKGLEDDDDFEKVIIKGKTFDLSLKKFITEINGKKPSTSREPVVDVTNLKNGTSTNADYKMPKSSLVVEAGDIVKYKIRVYNESLISGYAEEVVDYLPEGLGLLINYNDNIDNLWSVENAVNNGAEIIELNEIKNGTNKLKLEDFTGETSLEKVSVLVGKGAKIVSTKLSSNKESNLIKGFEEGADKLSYKDIEVTCIVIDYDLDDSQLKNIAEIEKCLDDKKEEVEDRDSKPGTVDINNYPGDDKNQDDNDYENLTQEDKKFDLSLQKFITGLNDEKITDRVPTVTKGENGKFKYSHKTDPLSVANTDLVTYTIRVYNEGEIAGYAAEIRDDMPKGLIFVEDNETNIKYGWKLYDKYGKVTEDLNQAVWVKTDYLSKEVSEERNEDALIEAMNDVRTTPDYKEVEIVFKVDDSVIPQTVTTDERIIINTAEISNDTDENGNDVEDVDSKPENAEKGEDDIDQEKVYVKYFDLELQKSMSKIIVIEDGVTKEILPSNKDELLKVEIHRKKLDTTIVKFMYDLVVTNNGEIEGFAIEVKDYVPEGLRFVAEDNPNWTLNQDGTIVTNELANTLLQPGESAVVAVTLTWINGENNLGEKKNYAEISEDFNVKGDTPDIGSIPNNKNQNEDDIDDANVILGVSTGSAPTYITLIFTILVISATGIILIKKYVI